MKCTVHVVFVCLLLSGCGAGVIEVDEVVDHPGGGDAREGFNVGSDQPGDSPGNFQAEMGEAFSSDYQVCDTVVRDAEATDAPNVLLVVDRSGSMRESTSADSWRTKLMDAKQALYRLLDFGEGKIRFGWMPFPLDWHCWPGLRTVDCSDDSISAISWRIFLLTARGGTPTGETLRSVLDYDAMHDRSRKNFVMLLTDGMPTCPHGDGTESNQEDNQLALQAVEDLRTHGIGTFVVGLGQDLNTNNPELLNQMARAGGQARSGATSYYPANNVWELEDAFENISHQVLSCTLKLNTPPDRDRWVWVTFDGRPVARDYSHSSGWDYERDLNQVRFFGAACARLQNGEVDQIVVKVGCLKPY